MICVYIYNVAYMPYIIRFHRKWFKVSGYMGVNIDFSFQVESQDEEGFFISSELGEVFFEAFYVDTRKCNSVGVLH